MVWHEIIRTACQWSGCFIGSSGDCRYLNGSAVPYRDIKQWRRTPPVCPQELPLRLRISHESGQVLWKYSNQDSYRLQHTVWVLLPVLLQLGLSRWQRLFLLRLYCRWHCVSLCIPDWHSVWLLANNSIYDWEMHETSRSVWVLVLSWVRPALQETS